LKQLQLIQIVSINALGRVSAAFAAAKAVRVNLLRPAPNGEKVASDNADAASAVRKRGNCGAGRFTAR
jgi:hypothetical protein